jgi:hypothetical protein
MGNRYGVPPGAGGGGDSKGGATGVFPPTPNGLNPQRYLVNPSAEVRLIPVAMVMICDQTAIPEVLAALANSKMRICVTQTIWRKSAVRAPGEFGPGRPADPGAGRFPPTRGPKEDIRPGVAPVPGVPVPGVPVPGSGGGFPGFGGMGAGFGGTGGPARRTLTADADAGDSDAVELQVYGIASFYDRYPERPKVDPNAPPPTTPAKP